MKNCKIKASDNNTLYLADTFNGRVTNSFRFKLNDINGNEWPKSFRTLKTDVFKCELVYGGVKGELYFDRKLMALNDNGAYLNFRGVRLQKKYRV